MLAMGIVGSEPMGRQATTTWICLRRWTSRQNYTNDQYGPDGPSAPQVLEMATLGGESARDEPEIRSWKGKRRISYLWKWIPPICSLYGIYSQLADVKA
jgi:hypothetical protein